MADGMADGIPNVGGLASTSSQRQQMELEKANTENAKTAAARRQYREKPLSRSNISSSSFEDSSDEEYKVKKSSARRLANENKKMKPQVLKEKNSKNVPKVPPKQVAKQQQSNHHDRNDRRGDELEGSSNQHQSHNVATEEDPQMEIQRLKAELKNQKDELERLKTSKAVPQRSYGTSSHQQNAYTFGLWATPSDAINFLNHQYPFAMTHLRYGDFDNPTKFLITNALQFLALSAKFEAGHWKFLTDPTMDRDDRVNALCRVPDVLARLYDCFAGGSGPKFKGLVTELTAQFVPRSKVPFKPSTDTGNDITRFESPKPAEFETVPELPQKNLIDDRNYQPIAAQEGYYRVSTAPDFKGNHWSPEFYTFQGLRDIRTQCSNVAINPRCRGFKSFSSELLSILGLLERSGGVVTEDPMTRLKDVTRYNRPYHIKALVYAESMKEHVLDMKCTLCIEHILDGSPMPDADIMLNYLFLSPYNLRTCVALADQGSLYACNGIAPSNLQLRKFRQCPKEETLKKVEIVNLFGRKTAPETKRKPLDLEKAKTIHNHKSIFDKLAAGVQWKSRAEQKEERKAEKEKKKKNVEKVKKGKKKQPVVIEVTEEEEEEEEEDDEDEEEEYDEMEEELPPSKKKQTNTKKPSTKTTKKHNFQTDFNMSENDGEPHRGRKRRRQIHSSNKTLTPKKNSERSDRRTSSHDSHNSSSTTRSENPVLTGE